MIDLLKRLRKNELLKIIIGAVIFAVALILNILEINVPATVLFVLVLLISGADVYISAIKGILRRDFLDEKFLMSIASVGAVIIGEYVEGAAVMLFFLLGEYFEHRAVGHSRSSIRSLLEICSDTANVISGDTEVTMDAEDVEIGSRIIVRAGERVPLDCIVESGNAEIDTSALTGEFFPTSVGASDTVHSGTMLINGSLVARVVCDYDNSSATRMLELVETANERKSKEERFISIFAKYYTPIVIVLALFMAILPPIFSLFSWKDSIYKALSFLVVSCPCALVISVPLAFFGGIGTGASLGVLYKGANIFSPVSKVQSIVFDKTGTLTTGEFKIGKINSFNMSEEEFIRLVASAEEGSSHPIASSLRALAGERTIPLRTEELVGKGVLAYFDGYSVAVGNRSLMSHLNVAVSHDDSYGIIYVAMDGEYIGRIEVVDSIKPEACEAIDRLKKMGVKRTYILSGDRESSVSYVADTVGIDFAFNSLMPEDKFNLLEKIISDTTGTVMYVGDGINDSPCLARADVGVAMGALGSDSAIEASDTVIMSDNLLRLTDIIGISRRTLRISKENIVFAIFVKILVMVLVSLGVVGMWSAVFADVGVAVIAILNSMRTLLYRRR